MVYGDPAMDPETREQLITTVQGAVDSHDPSKMQLAILRVQLATLLDDKKPDRKGREMNWVEVGAVVGLLGAMFLWGHGDLSRDVDRVEDQVTEVRQSLGAFKDETYRRLGDLQADVASIKASVVGDKKVAAN